jgi:Kef-type K+ transport system membrane component KefB
MNDALQHVFYTFLGGVVGGEIAQRCRAPQVVGQVVAGLVIGPSCLGLVTLDESLHLLAELGAVILLFLVGLETSLESLKRLGMMPFKVGSIGVIIPFCLSYVWSALALGTDFAASLFVGACFVATSAGITAKVLRDFGALQREESKIILGAAVIDDVLGMLVLGVVASFQRPEGFSVGVVVGGLIGALVFVALALWIGGAFIKRHPRLLDLPLDPLSPLTLSLLLCVGLSLISEYVGLAAIIGAFVAGVIIAEYRERDTLLPQVESVAAFLTPFFFVVTGVMVSLNAFTDARLLGLLASALAIAAVSKFVAGYLCCRSMGRNSGLIVGVGMVPRGEVGILIATIGLETGVFGEDIFGVLVGMSLLTSILAPPALRVLLAK